MKGGIKAGRLLAQLSISMSSSFVRHFLLPTHHSSKLHLLNLSQEICGLQALTGDMQIVSGSRSDAFNEGIVTTPHTSKRSHLSTPTPTPHGLYDGRPESSNPSRLALGWNSNGDSSHEEDVILDDQHLYTPQPGYTGWQKTSYSPPTVTVSFKGKGDTPSRNNTLSRDTAYEDADILKAQVALQQDEDGRQELQVMVDNKITRDRQEIESLKKDLEDQVQRIRLFVRSVMTTDTT